MRVLVTGASGQLGRAAVACVEARGHEVIAASHSELAVEEPMAAQSLMLEQQPQFVLHCGAWTNVDGCEEDPARADAVNGTGTRMVAEACQAVGAGLVYVSTDFVFDGSATEPYPVDAPTAPLSAYGKSKLLGEQAVMALQQPNFYVVRTSWVFGPGGKNFPRAILNRALEGNPLTVVDDQVGSPTYTHHLAEAMLDMAEQTPEPGIYHASNEGVISWHQFACDLVEAAGLKVPVDRMSSAELKRPAPRPSWSALDCSRLATVRGRPLPNYKDAIWEYLSAENIQTA